jgi:hypothetical protein
VLGLFGRNRGGIVFVEGGIHIAGNSGIRIGVGIVCCRDGLLRTAIGTEYRADFQFGTTMDASHRNTFFL